MQGTESNGLMEGGVDGRSEGSWGVCEWLLHTEMMHKWRESVGDSRESWEGTWGLGGVKDLL